VSGFGFERYGPTLRVEGGIKARSERGAIGESWWSKRFLAVLEALAIGGRLNRGRAYARQGQVLRLTVAPGKVKATVQGSRPTPYRVKVKLAVIKGPAWSRIEAALAAQALFSARLLAGDMPAEIEEVFAAAGAPLFPTAPGQLVMECSCPDWSVPCKHLAATFYLLAEAFDEDPFEILHWRGREREALLAALRQLRTDDPGESIGGSTAAALAGRAAVAGAAALAGDATAAVLAGGAALALADVASPELAETVDRFWVSPVPLPHRPPTLDTDVDLVLRQLPTPPAAIGGADLAERLRALYTTFAAPPALPG
jgi:uncharacterized Zn finger protein